MLVHRLKHPIRAIREPFGTAGLIIACVALIAALGGTALAAAKLNGTQKKEVEKIAKKFAGKPGASGAPGSAGAKGDQGEKGAAGENGAPGADGKSVVTTTIGVGGQEGHCVGVGGTALEVEGSGAKHYTCNGTNGAPGEPWTAGGVLPAGATETGSYAFVSSTSEYYEPISFSIPLAGELAETDAHFTGQPEFSTYCPGNILHPTAVEGNLCVYQLPGSLVHFSGFQKPNESEGFGSTGGFLWFTNAEGNYSSGSWAVTGFEAP